MNHGDFCLLNAYEYFGEVCEKADNKNCLLIKRNSLVTIIRFFLSAVDHCHFATHLLGHCLNLSPELIIIFVTRDDTKRWKTRTILTVGFIESCTGLEGCLGGKL